VQYPFDPENPARHVHWAKLDESCMDVLFSGQEVALELS
jgi:hypothetical protein